MLWKEMLINYVKYQIFDCNVPSLGLSPVKEHIKELQNIKLFKRIIAGYQTPVITSYDILFICLKCISN